MISTGRMPASVVVAKRLEAASKTARKADEAVAKEERLADETGCEWEMVTARRRAVDAAWLAMEKAMTAWDVKDMDAVRLWADRAGHAAAAAGGSGYGVESVQLEMLANDAVAGDDSVQERASARFIVRVAETDSGWKITRSQWI